MFQEYFRYSQKLGLDFGLNLSSNSKVRVMTVCLVAMHTSVMVLSWLLERSFLFNVFIYGG